MSRRAGRARRWCRCFIARWRARWIGDGPTCFVNIGGVANITYMDGDKPLIACDTGPGNALLDDFMLKTTGQAVDRDGVLAATRHVSMKRGCSRSCGCRSSQQPPPKSLDRNRFCRDWSCRIFRRPTARQR